MRSLLLSLLALLAGGLFALAQTGDYEIAQIDAKAGTISGKLNGQIRTFRVRPAVETTLNGLKASFEELEPGMKVKITSAEPGVATRLVATGLRMRPAPVPAAPTAPTATATPAASAPAPAKPVLGGTAQPARQEKASIAANNPNGFPIGDVRKGTKISIQYVSGKWKHEGRIAQFNPDSDELKPEDNNHLCVSLPAVGDKGGEVVAIVPSGTAKHPFVYEADKDFPGLVLRINNDGAFKRGPGTTEWTVKVLPPAR